MSEPAPWRVHAWVSGRSGNSFAPTLTLTHVQVEGITLEVLAAALAQAGDARRHILAQMARCAPAPRGALAPCAPRIVRFNIDPTRIGYMIGAGGKNIRALQAAPGIENISVRHAPCVSAKAPHGDCCRHPKLTVAAVHMIGLCGHTSGCYTVA